MHSTDTSRLYADHPHLSCIDELWGTPQCRAFITRLLTDTRGGERRGFEPDNASTIFRLLFEHDRAYPDLDLEHGGAWWLLESDRNGATG